MAFFLCVGGAGDDVDPIVSFFTTWQRHRLTDYTKLILDCSQTSFVCPLHDINDRHDSYLIYHRETARHHRSTIFKTSFVRKVKLMALFNDVFNG